MNVAIAPFRRLRIAQAVSVFSVATFRLHAGAQPIRLLAGLLVDRWNRETAARREPHAHLHHAVQPERDLQVFHARAVRDGTLAGTASRADLGQCVDIRGLSSHHTN